MKWSAGLVAVFAYVLGACADDPAIEDGQRAAEAVLMATEVVGLAHAFAAPSAGADDASIVTRAAAQAQVSFTPTGCTRVQTNGSAVRVTFLGACDGPYGMRVLDGVLTAAVTLRDGQVEVALSGDVHTSHSTLHPALNVTVNATAQGAYTADYAGNFTGTGSRGTAVSFDGRGVGSVDDHCVQLNGSAAITAGGEPWTVIVSNVNRCADGCPMSAGELLLNRAAGTQTRVEFTGNDGVAVTGMTGRAQGVTVPCGG